MCSVRFPGIKASATFAFGVLLVSLACAEPPGLEVPRIGYLTPTFHMEKNPLIESFLLGLRDGGYIEGKNVHIEYRYANADPDRFQSLAAELVALDVDVLFAPTMMGTLAAQFETETIPIVFTLVADPVGSGLITSMARPGGNITGVSITSTDLNGKRLELLKDALPHISRVGVLYNANVVSRSQLEEIGDVAQALDITIEPIGIRSRAELEGSLAKASRRGVEALLVPASPLILGIRKQVVQFAAQSALPGMYELSEFVDEGGLMAYGPNFAELYRRAAVYVIKILHGADPAKLPVEQPMRFELVINLKAAAAIGVTIPKTLQFRADRVIE